MSGAWRPGPAQPTATVGEVHVWRIPIDLGAEPESALLNPAEKARAGRFIPAHARRQFIAARTGLRRILARYTGRSPAALAFETGTRGKPRFPTGSPHAGLHFNLSHAGSWALVSVRNGFETGVDVETASLRHEPRKLAARFFSSTEADWVLAAKNDADLLDRFFSVWTRKEAVVKALGLGITAPLEAFSTLPVTAQAVETCMPSCPQSLWVAPVPMPRDYRAAVASLTPKAALHLFDA